MSTFARWFTLVALFRLLRRRDHSPEERAKVVTLRNLARGGSRGG